MKAKQVKKIPTSKPTLVDIMHAALDNSALVKPGDYFVGGCGHRLRDVEDMASDCAYCQDIVESAKFAAQERLRKRASGRELVGLLIDEAMGRQSKEETTPRLHELLDEIAPLPPDSHPA